MIIKLFMCNGEERLLSLLDSDSISLVGLSEAVLGLSPDEAFTTFAMRFLDAWYVFNPYDDTFYREV